MTRLENEPEEEEPKTTEPRRRLELGNAEPEEPKTAGVAQQLKNFWDLSVTLRNLSLTFTKFDTAPSFFQCQIQRAQCHIESRVLSGKTTQTFQCDIHGPPVSNPARWMSQTHPLDDIDS